MSRRRSLCRLKTFALPPCVCVRGCKYSVPIISLRQDLSLDSSTSSSQKHYEKRHIEDGCPAVTVPQSQNLPPRSAKWSFSTIEGGWASERTNGCYVKIQLGSPFPVLLCCSSPSSLKWSQETETCAAFFTLASNLKPKTIFILILLMGHLCERE